MHMGGIRRGGGRRWGSKVLGVSAPAYPPGPAFLFDATELALADGAAVATWPDSSGNAVSCVRNPSYSVSPSYSASAFSGAGGVALSPAAFSGLILPGYSAVASDRTFCWVVQNTLTGEFCVFDDSTGRMIVRPNISRVLAYYATSLYAYAGMGANNTSGPVTIVLRLNRSAKQGDLWINGRYCGSVVTTGVTSNAIGGAVAIDGDFGQTAFMLDGDIGLAAMWQRALSVSEIEELHAAVAYRFPTVVNAPLYATGAGVAVSSMADVQVVASPDSRVMQHGFSFEYVPQFDMLDTVNLPSGTQMGLFSDGSRYLRLYKNSATQCQLNLSNGSSTTVSNIAFTAGQTLHFSISHRFSHVRCLETGDKVSLATAYDAAKAWAGATLRIGDRNGVANSHARGTIRNVIPSHVVL